MFKKNIMLKESYLPDDWSPSLVCKSIERHSFKYRHISPSCDFLLTVCVVIQEMTSSHSSSLFSPTSRNTSHHALVFFNQVGLIFLLFPFPFSSIWNLMFYNLAYKHKTVWGEKFTNWDKPCRKLWHFPPNGCYINSMTVKNILLFSHITFIRFI